jgi:hypothetical protein
MRLKTRGIHKIENKKDNRAKTKLVLLFKINKTDKLLASLIYREE